MQNALVKDGLISRLRKYGCLCGPGRGIGKPFFLCCLGTGQPPKHLLAASPKIRPLCPSAQMGCKELPTQMAHRPIPLGLHIPTHQGTTRWRGETESTPFTQPTSLPPQKNVYFNATLSSFTQHFTFNPRNTHGVSRRHGVWVSSRMGHITGSSLASILNRLFAGPPSPLLWGKG